MYLSWTCTKSPPLTSVGLITNILPPYTLHSMHSIPTPSLLTYSLFRQFATASLSSPSPRKRRGLLKLVDLAQERDGYVGGAFFTSLVRKAQSSREVVDLVNEATTRFENAVPPWQLLSAAAYVSASSTIDNPQLAGSLLSRIPREFIPRVREGAFRTVLGNASKHKNSSVALQAFRYLLAGNTPLIITDYVRVIHSGIDSNEETRLMDELLQQPCPSDLDPRAIGVLLKVCDRRHNFMFGNRVWEWATPRRRARYGNNEDLCYIVAQYLLLCGRTGNMEIAKRVWQEAKTTGLTQVPIVTGSMLSIFAAHGAEDETLALLKDISPDSLNSHMLTAGLTAFSHSGNVDAARELLASVVGHSHNHSQRSPGDAPVAGIKAYTALVDAYARKGDFSSALKVIEQAKSKKGVGQDDVMWMTVLSPCRHFKNLPVARIAFDAVQRLGSPECRAAAYVLMSDVYRACGNLPAALRIQQERLKKGLAKERGAVTLSVDGKTHVFHVAEIPAEISHASEDIYKKLEEWSLWLSSCGVSNDSIRCQHSENLALAYAVTQKMKHVVIRKNLRICGACHEASKHITRLEGILIHHWDRLRLHVMEDGECSCADRY